MQQQCNIEMKKIHWSDHFFNSYGLLDKLFGDPNVSMSVMNTRSLYELYL